VAHLWTDKEAPHPCSRPKTCPLLESSCQSDPATLTGERIGISGFCSGIGKLRVLRMLAGLDASTWIVSQLHASSLLRTSWPQVHTQICLVPQNRPHLEGTPSQFYQEIQQLEHQRHRQQQLGQTSYPTATPCLFSTRNRACERRRLTPCATSKKWIPIDRISEINNPPEVMKVILRSIRHRQNKTAMHATSSCH
jgi:hypothetical protein